MTKPNKQSKAEERGRMKSKGFVRREYWVHKSDLERVDRYMKQQREKHNATK